jgi:hypothetical protein
MKKYKEAGFACQVILDTAKNREWLGPSFIEIGNSMHFRQAAMRPAFGSIEGIPLFS